MKDLILMSETNPALSLQLENMFDTSSDKQTEQQKEHENIFMQLEKNLSLIPSAFYWKDRNHRFLGVNKVALQYVNLQSATEICGKTDYDIWPAEYAEKYVQDDLYVLETGQIISKEDEYLDLAGNVKYCQVIKAPLYDSENNIIGIIGNSIDITVQKEALKREAEHQQIVIQEQEKFRKIVGQVAHDIGSPLTTLAMMLTVNLALSEEERITLNDAATRIGDIAENLLSFYRPEKTAAELAEERKPLLIYLALLKLLAEKRYQHYGRPISFETDFQPDCHFVFAELEECPFRCMLSNLVNNAVDAFDDRPGVVTVGFAADGEQVKITVGDNGKGMSRAVVDKIMNNVAVTEGKADGHGIGLTQGRWSRHWTDTGTRNPTAQSGYLDH